MTTGTGYSLRNIGKNISENPSAEVLGHIVTSYRLAPSSLRSLLLYSSMAMHQICSFKMGAYCLISTKSFESWCTWRESGGRSTTIEFVARKNGGIQVFISLQCDLSKGCTGSGRMSPLVKSSAVQKHKPVHTYVLDSLRHGRHWHASPSYYYIYSEYCNAVLRFIKLRKLPYIMFCLVFGLNAQEMGSV